MNQSGLSGYRIDQFPLVAPDVPEGVRRQPSLLLAARYQVVNFAGRDTELVELADWRDDPGPAVGARLIYGPGGQGKTRLASVFAQRSAERGWMVVRGAHRSYDTAVGAGLDPEQVAAERGLLVIVDYAERWPVSDLLALIQDPLLRSGAPTRVLLLARPAGPWWNTLTHRLRDQFNIAAEAMALGPLADTAGQRAALFAAARDRFVVLLGVSGAEGITPPPGLEAEAFGLVLTVHMAALAAVDAHTQNQIPPADPAALSGYLLARERDHWASMFDNHRVATHPEVMARAVFTAILTRPLPLASGVAALARVGISAPDQVLDDHRVCYPPVDPASVCEPLYPDRLAEDFLALLTPGHLLPDYQPDPWAVTAPARLLAPDSETQPPIWGPVAMTVLIETARRWPHIARDQLRPLLRAQPHLALAAGGVAITRLADIPDVDPRALEAIEALLPQGRHVEMDISAAALTTRLTTHRLATTFDPAERARLYAILGYRLAKAGQWEEALAATGEAVEIHRLWALHDPAAFEPGLASALGNLGSRLWNLGRREEALAATSEAVEIYRRLAVTNPAAFGRELALALSNLSVDLSNLGRREEALAASGEAVEIHRRLTGAKSAAFEPGLASALNNLGTMLSNLGRREEALGASGAAVEICRRLAVTNPAAFEPDLALALNNLGNSMSKLGQREKALAATGEAVEIYRRLAVTNPAAFEPDLALGLWGFALVRVVARMELAQALTAIEESITRYEGLARQRPQVFTDDLHNALATLADVLDGLDRGEEAVEVRRRIGGR